MVHNILHTHQVLLKIKNLFQKINFFFISKWILKFFELFIIFELFSEISYYRNYRRTYRYCKKKK